MELGIFILFEKSKFRSSFSLKCADNTGRYIFGQVMSPKLSDQMLQRSQVSGVALCMSKVKVPSVTE